MDYSFFPTNCTQERKFYLLLLFLALSWLGVFVDAEDGDESKPGGGGLLTFPDDTCCHAEFRLPAVFSVSDGRSCFSISFICCSILSIDDCA